MTKLDWRYEYLSNELRDQKARLEEAEKNIMEDTLAVSQLSKEWFLTYSIQTVKLSR